jgi:hypothetical protein
MDNTTKTLIYFLIELLDQLDIQSKEDSSLLSFDDQRLKDVKENLFQLTIKQEDHIDIRSHLLNRLPSYLKDKKKFRYKKDLLAFAKPLQIKQLEKTDNKSMNDIIVIILIDISSKSNNEMAELYYSMYPEKATYRDKRITPLENTQSSNSNRYDFYQSTKR